MAKSTWQSIAHQVQGYRDSTVAQIYPSVPDVSLELPLNVTIIPKQLLSTREVEITELAPEALIESLALGKLISIEVTKAFLRRAGAGMFFCLLPY